MKLSLTYKNATIEAISVDLKEELDQAVTEANRMLLDWVGSPAAVVARPMAVTVVSADDLYSQMTAEKVEEPIFVAAQVPPEDGYMRLVFMLDNGRGCVDVLIEEN